MASPTRSRHTKKFDGGKRTPQEYHAEYGIPPRAKCIGCGRRPIVRAIVMAPFDEACRRGMLPPEVVSPAEAMSALVMLKDGSEQKPFIRVSTTYACRACAPTMERTLGRAPSWCVVEVNRGPDPTNRIVA